MKLITGDPFWPRRSGLLRTYPPLRADSSADVVVVGAGISGALIAHELSTTGIDVVVVDERDVVSGSTAATSGLLLYDTDSSLEDLTRETDEATAQRVYQLGLEAIDRIEHLIGTLGHPCGFARRPSLYLASRRSHVPALATEYERRHALGYDVTWLNRTDLEAISTIRAPAALSARQTAEIDCYQLTHALLVAASEKGARLFDRTRVLPPTCTKTDVTLRTTDGFALRASKVVWATGYDAARMLRRQTGNLASTWVFVSEPLSTFDGWPDRCLIWETARPYLYLRSTDDGRLMAGGEDEPCAECHRSEAWFARKIRRIRTRVTAMFPRIPIDVAFAWAGTFATTDDGLPFIGSVEEWPGVIFALGYGGNGITFSVIAASIVRDLYLGRPNPDADIFSFERPRQAPSVAADPCRDRTQ
jgi:glycine/D-amino acid oxidase-like deaminating enzyme